MYFLLYQFVHTFPFMSILLDFNCATVLHYKTHSFVLKQGTKIREVCAIYCYVLDWLVTPVDPLL